MPRLDIESESVEGIIQVLKKKVAHVLASQGFQIGKILRAIERFENAVVTVNYVISSVYPR